LQREFLLGPLWACRHGHEQLDCLAQVLLGLLIGKPRCR